MPIDSIRDKDRSEWVAELTGSDILEPVWPWDTCSLDAPWEGQPLPGPFYEVKECPLDKSICWLTVRHRWWGARSHGYSSMISFVFVMVVTIRTVKAKLLENSFPEIEQVISNVWSMLISSLAKCREDSFEDILSSQDYIHGCGGDNNVMSCRSSIIDSMLICDDGWWTSA